MINSINKSWFENAKLSGLWLLIRVYLGWEWFHAGYEKVSGQGWVGKGAGTAITGFVNNALTKTSGAHPDVSMWYAWFLKTFVLTHPVFWSCLVSYGEVLVGLGLIFGAFTFLAAFFGFFMNLNYLLAGTVSTNPVLLILSLVIMLAGKTAGLIGLDPYISKKFS